MSTHQNTRQQLREFNDDPAHAHRVAEQQGKQEHLSGNEHSRQAQEHTPDSHQYAEAPTVGHGIAAFGHNDIATLAHELWQARGCPEGSSHEDWFHAAEELRSRAHTR